MLVKLQVETGKLLHLSTLTVHIGTFYMDYVLSKKELHSQLYPVIALTCLIIAAKYDELDKNIPPYDDYIGASNVNTSSQSITECEMWLLEQLNWNLRVVTPVIFVHLFLTQGVLFVSDKTTKGPVNEILAKKISRQANTFVESALETHKMLEFSQSILAAACIALSRQVFSITPVWPHQLTQMTGYEFESISKCVSALSSYYFKTGTSAAKKVPMRKEQVLEPKNSFLNDATSMAPKQAPKEIVKEEKKTPQETENVIVQQHKPVIRPRSRVILRIGQDGTLIKGGVVSTVSVNRSTASGFDTSCANNNAVAKAKKIVKRVVVRESVGVKPAISLVKKGTKENAGAPIKPKVIKAPKMNGKNVQRKDQVLPLIVHKNLRV